MTHYIFKPCQSAAGFVVLPKKSTRLKLEQIKLRLAAAGYSIVDAKVMLVVTDKTRNMEITLYPSGKLLLNSNDEAAARAAAEALYAAAGI